MGAVWNVFCTKHRENLSFSGDFREFRQLPPDLVQRLRARALSRVTDPEEIKMVERFHELLSAFLDRHEGCKLAAVSDLDDEYSSIFLDEESWTEFSLFEDSVHNQHALSHLKRTKPEVLVPADYWPNRADMHRREIERAVQRLRSGNLEDAARVALVRELEDQKRGLAAAERLQRFRYKDVLAMIRNAPLGQRGRPKRSPT